MKKLTLFIAGLLFIAQIASAKEFSADAAHSNVGFTIRHLVSKVNGEFKDFEAHFSFDSAKPTDSKLKATIKAASINTNNEKRDAHLKSGDFFEVEKFPTLSFESKKVTAAGKDKFNMTGDLMIHGITKPVTFNVEYLGESPDPWGGTRAGFTATAQINRKDFGVSWNKNLDKGGLVLGDDVTININIEAILQTGAKK